MRQQSPRRTGSDDPVSLGGTAVEVGLRYPVVHYPPHYGTFIGFAESDVDRPCLCSCAHPVVDHFLRLMIQGEDGERVKEFDLAQLSRRHLPPSVIIAPESESTDVFKSLRFEDGLCHRCQLTPPVRRWCHAMYGGRFKQRFGWYINQAHFRVGISPADFAYLPDVCPPELKGKIEEVRSVEESYDREFARVMEVVEGPPRSDIASDEVTYWRNLREEEAAPMLELRHQRDSLRRKLKNTLENIVREEFGFRKIGKAWVSETLLYQIIRRIFQGQLVLHHHRPEWLRGLELDIFLPELNLGLEYQGQQHFHPIEAWGGASALEAVQARDERKRQLCAEARITLVEIDYTEPLTEDHIRKRLTTARVL